MSESAKERSANLVLGTALLDISPKDAGNHRGHEYGKLEVYANAPGFILKNHWAARSHLFSHYAAILAPRDATIFHPCPQTV